MKISVDCASEVTAGLDEDLRSIVVVEDLNAEGEDLRIEQADTVSVKGNTLSVRGKFTRDGGSAVDVKCKSEEVATAIGQGITRALARAGVHRRAEVQIPLELGEELANVAGGTRETDALTPFEHIDELLFGAMFGTLLSYGVDEEGDPVFTFKFPSPGSA
jgi:hypothetical protein